MTVTHKRGGRRRLVLALRQRLVGETLALALEDVGFDVVLTDREALENVAAHDAPITIAVEIDPRERLDDLVDLSAQGHVLVVSPHVDDDLIARSLAGGARGIISLDASLDEIRDAVVSVSAGRTVVRGVAIKEPVNRTELAGDDKPWHSLTPRERMIVARLARGDSTTKIASDLGIAQNTARTHIQNVLAKLDVHSRLEAAALAVREGLD